MSGAEMIEANLDAKAEELLSRLSDANRDPTRWFVKVRRNSRIGPRRPASTPVLPWRRTSSSRARHSRKSRPWSGWISMSL